MTLPEIFFNPKQAREMANHSSEKKNRGSKFWFLRMPELKCLKCDSSDKNGQLSSYQCVFHQIEANLATIQLQKHQNVKKTNFGKKFQVSMG